MANENVNIVIKAFDRTRGAFSTATRGINAVARAATSLRAGLVAVAGAGGFAYMVKSSLDATDALAKTASRIGTTTEALSRLQYVGKLTGVETNTMSMALQRFTRRTAEAAKGTGEAQGALRELGLDAQQLSTLPLDEQMQQVANAFGGVANESDKVRLAFKLFDSEGVALVNTLKLGADGMAELMAEAEQLGVVMSAQAARGVEAASDSLYRLGRLGIGLRDQFVAALAPAIETVSENLKQMLLDSASARGGIRALATEMATSFINALITIARAFESFFQSIQTAIYVINKAAFNWDRIFNKEGLHAQREQAISDLEDVRGKLNGILSGFLSEEEIAALNEREKELMTQIGVLSEQIRQSAPTKETFNLDGLVAALEAARASLGGLLKDVEDGGKAETQQLTIFDRMYESLQKVREELPTVQDIFNNTAKSIANAFTEGFTDAITGAKKFSDAIRDMAKNVIDSLIRMLIQKYIVDAAFGFITKQIGMASLQEIQVTAQRLPMPGKAIGGSVQAGKAYMVGERGAEMFIPNQSGSIVANDRIGGSGVTVNQVINVSTGVQQTVRAEIQNLMPQIANSAKAAVADARMRGGSYSKALVGA